MAKVQKLENLGTIGLLRRSVGNPRHGVDLRQGVGYPRRGEAEVPKLAPLEYVAAQLLFTASSFWIFVSENLVVIHRYFRDPNKGLMRVHIRVYERENVLYLCAWVFVLNN